MSQNLNIIWKMKKPTYQWVGNMVNLAFTKKLLKLTLTRKTLDPMKHQKFDYHSIYVVDKNNRNIDGSVVKRGNFNQLLGKSSKEGAQIFPLDHSSETF
jgi:hypothetical protein